MAADKPAEAMAKHIVSAYNATQGHGMINVGIIQELPDQIYGHSQPVVQM